MEMNIAYESENARKSKIGFHTFPKVIQLDDEISQRITRIGELSASALKKTTEIVSKAFANNGEEMAWLRNIMLGSIPFEHRGFASELMIAVGNRCPVRFFRADVVGEGKIAELQCPGSGWAYTLWLETHYNINPSRIIQAYRDWTQGRTAYWWLHDEKHANSVNALIAVCRLNGLDIQMTNADTLDPDRAELVIKRPPLPELIAHPKGRRLLQRWLEGKVELDLLPTMVPETKYMMALFYHPATRDCFSEEERNLAPPTYFIQSENQTVEFVHAKQKHRTIKEIIDRHHEAIVKYGGAIKELRGGCHAVYNLGVNSMKHKSRQDLIKRAIADYQRGEAWIIQEYVPAYWPVAVSRFIGDAIQQCNAIFRPHYYIGSDGIARLVANTITARANWKVHAQSDAYLGLCV